MIKRVITPPRTDDAAELERYHRRTCDLLSSQAEGATTLQAQLTALQNQVNGIVIPDPTPGGTTAAFVNVKDYNVKGDGQTDDTAALQAVYNAAGPGTMVFYPPGVYLISPSAANALWITGGSNRHNYACILVPDGVTSVGCGPASQIKLNNTLADPGVTDGLAAYATTHMFANRLALGLPRTPVNRDIHFRELAFNGNNVPMSGEAICFAGVKNFSFLHCTVYNAFFESNYVVFCRGGLIAHNNFRQNGLFQIDGSGPFIDTSSDIAIIDNILSDCGYYAILAIDCWDCRISGNQVRRDTYGTSTGYEGVRLARCFNCNVSDNKIVEAGYSGILLHDSQNNIVAGNMVIRAGFGSGGGASLHGIAITGTSARNTIAHNYSINNKGAGIGLVEQGDTGNTFAVSGGETVQGNTCLFNLRDGIAVYGTRHRISGNLVESNGLAVQTGVLGDGYSGIALNGARFCIIEGNTCTDDLQQGVVNLNLDAILGNYAYLAPLTVNHTNVQTQNYGIVAYPNGDIVSDYNIVTNNNLTNNLANAWYTPVAGGYYRRPGQGLNDVIANNLAA